MSSDDEIRAVSGTVWIRPKKEIVNLDDCFSFVSKLVDKAGAMVLKANETRREYEEKANEIDLVTETDKRVEQFLIDEISQKYPHHKFIGEEESSDTKEPMRLTDAPTWIIDPIDGTMNFVHGFPHSCISVGLVVRQITELGIVYNPLMQHRFWARRGRGAYCNGERLQVSSERSLAKALVFSEFGTSRDPVKLQVVCENFTKIAGKAGGIRCLGSATLNMCMVALGVADINYEFGIHAWDVCAADLIVREAGGVVRDPADRPFDMMSRRVLAASCYGLVRQIVPLLKQFHPQPRDDEIMKN